jgi:hypothetical protein
MRSTQDHSEIAENRAPVTQECRKLEPLAEYVLAQLRQEWLRLLGQNYLEDKWICLGDCE